MSEPEKTLPEPIDQWPRVSTCLYNWCPYQSSECYRCDAVMGTLRSLPKEPQP